MANSYKLFLIILFSALASLTSCSNQHEDIFLTQALELRIALNNQDTETLANLVGSSLTIREQQWEATESETDLVLVTKSDSKILNNLNNQKGLILLAETLFIEGTQPKLLKHKEKLYRRELLGIEHNWSNLELVGFYREQEDVQHLVLLGFDPSTKKLLAIYSN
ncbi:hypothetical protein NBRC116493_35580 [Aurantivibrio infirmus]